jgi:LemA protein
VSVDLWLIILIVVVVVIIGGFILLYNGLQQKRLRVSEAWSQIEVQLKRRWDLIPNLVSAVQGYMGFEQRVLTDVTNARAAAVAAGAQGPAQSSTAENALTGTLRSLFAVVENYPDLKASTNVLQLQEQLTTTENQISFARQHYNATVLDYNTSLVTIPSNLVAGPLGFTKSEFFDAEPAAEQVPTVNLGFSPAPGAPAVPPLAPSVALPPPPPAPPAAPPAPPVAPPPPAPPGAPPQA